MSPNYAVTRSSARTAASRSLDQTPAGQAGDRCFGGGRAAPRPRGRFGTWVSRSCGWISLSLVLDNFCTAGCTRVAAFPSHCVCCCLKLSETWWLEKGTPQGGTGVINWGLAPLSAASPCSQLVVRAPDIVSEGTLTPRIFNFVGCYMRIIWIIISLQAKLHVPISQLSCVGVKQELHLGLGNLLKQKISAALWNLRQDV